MHFRLGRSRGSPREEDAPNNDAGMHLPPSAVQYDMSKPTHGQVDFERVKTSPGRNNHEEKEHGKPTTVQAPQFLPALDPLSDPSSDEYESSPEHHHNRVTVGRQHHKLAVSPHQLLAAALHIKHSSSPPSSDQLQRNLNKEAKSPRVGGIFHRHHGGSGGKTNRRQQHHHKARDADSVARGVARGAAQAHADSTGRTTKQQEIQPDNGFLNILLGEHAQIMEQLNEKAPSDPAVYHASASTPTKAGKNKTDEVESKAAAKAKTPPMSSLQRRLAQMKAPATPTKGQGQGQGQGQGVSKASTTPPPTAIATTLSPASPSSNHRHRTQWSPSSQFDVEEDDDEEEEEALSTTILPYYEACDEVVNRLGIGSRPSRHADATHTSPDASPAKSTASTSTDATHASRSPARRIGASAATYPRDGGADDDGEDVDSPVKLARIVGSGAIPYHPATSTSSTSTRTSTATSPPAKLARILGCGVIPTIPEEDGEEEEEADDSEEIAKGEPDTAVRRLTFDLPEDMACGGDEIADEAAALDLADAGSKAGQIVGGRDDGTVSLLTAGSALSSYRRATERAAAAKAEAGKSLPPPPAPKKSSLQRALVAKSSAKPSSLQLALAASASTNADLLPQPSTPNRSNVTKSRSLGGGAMTLEDDKEANVDTSAPHRRVGIATVPAVERVVLPARGGAGIVPVKPAEAAAESRALVKSEVSRHNERRRMSSHKSAVYLLLLDPAQKIFELCAVRFDPSTSTVGSVIDRIAKHATEPGLAKLKYSALVRPGDGTVLSRIKDEYKCAPIEDGEVLVAVPEWEEPSKCQKIANPILADPKLKKLLKRARQHREKSKRGSRSRGKSSNRDKNKSSSTTKRSGTSNRTKTDPRDGGRRATSSSDKLKTPSPRKQVQPATPPTSPLASSSPSPSSTSPSIEEFRKAAVDAASIAATQAVDGRFSDLEKRITDSQERDARARKELENDLRLQIEARAKARADIEEHLFFRLQSAQKVTEDEKPAYQRIEELAQKAKAGNARPAVSNVEPSTEVARKQEESFSDKALRKAKRIIVKISRKIDVDSIKTLAMCLGAAIALRVAFLAIDCAIDTFMTGLGQLFTPASVSYGLEVYVPALENPYNAAETKQAFGFTGILVLTCFFAILMVVQKSIEEKKRIRRLHSSPRRRIRSLIHSPGKSITTASSFHIGSGTMSSRKAPKDPWGARHY